jgi:hypothetical protein
MGKLQHIGPLIKLKKIISETMEKLLAESPLDYVKDRYELTAQTLEALNKNPEARGLFTDVVNSFNGDKEITQSDIEMIIPRMVKSFFSDLDVMKSKTQANESS